MARLVFAEARSNTRLFVRFDDGVEGIVELRNQCMGPMLKPLLVQSYFEQVFVDEFGAPAWPPLEDQEEGVDLAPDALYQKLRAAQGEN